VGAEVPNSTIKKSNNMSKVKKNNWFNGQGTISGTAAIFRPFATILFYAMGNVFIEEGAFGLGLLILMPHIALSISTLIKRARALSVDYSVTANVLIYAFVPFAGLYYNFSDAKVFGGGDQKHNG